MSRQFNCAQCGKLYPMGVGPKRKDGLLFCSNECFDERYASKKPEHTDEQKNIANTFMDLLVAAMSDAAVEKKMTQLKAVITPEGTTRPVHVRIIVVPELMDREFNKPLGSNPG